MTDKEQKNIDADAADVGTAAIESVADALAHAGAELVWAS